MNKSVAVLIETVINIYRGGEAQLVFFLKSLTQEKDCYEEIRIFT